MTLQDLAHLRATSREHECLIEIAVDGGMLEVIEAKTRDIEHKTVKKQDEKHTPTTKNDDSEGTLKELGATLAYFDFDSESEDGEVMSFEADSTGDEAAKTKNIERKTVKRQDETHAQGVPATLEEMEECAEKGLEQHKSSGSATVRESISLLLAGLRAALPPKAPDKEQDGEEAKMAEIQNDEVVLVGACSAAEDPDTLPCPKRGRRKRGKKKPGVTLNAIEANSAKLDAGTDVAEPLVQKEYDTFMTDSKGNEDEGIQDIEHQTAKKQNETQTLTTKDSENTQKKHGGDGSLLS